MGRFNVGGGIGKERIYQSECSKTTIKKKTIFIEIMQKRRKSKEFLFKYDNDQKDYQNSAKKQESRFKNKQST